MTNHKSDTNSKSKSSNPQKIFIGVSWPYANGDLSIGHLAGQNVVCDVFARYHRLRGNEVLMVSGTDAHGTPVTIKAEELGLTPEETAEKFRLSQLDTFKKLNCAWDLFTTTETENHKTVARNLFQVMYAYGFIIPKNVKQYYDEEAKKYLADRYIEGTCPYCGNTKARGDQCNDGCERTLDPTDLIDPKSKLTGTTPVLKDHTILYFDLEKFQKDIGKLVKDRKNIWRKSVISVVKKWLKEGLRPRPVTRKLGYGVKVPIEEYKDQDIYVWFEAVMGYLSAAIEWAEKSGDPAKWEYFWKDPEAKHYYFIAKDNIPFHTFLWPAMLMAYNSKYTKGKFEPALPGETNADPLQIPYDVPSNQFLNMRGRKLSKSRGKLITANELLDDYDTDLVRYFFTRNAPENHDKDFIWKDLIDANNNELVANIGNFVNRVMTFTVKNFDEKVPDGKLDSKVQKAIEKALTSVADHFEKAEFTRAAEAALDLGHFANKYLNEEKPWITIKHTSYFEGETPEWKDEDFPAPQKPKEFLHNTIFNCIQIIRTFQIILDPIVPSTSDKIGSILNTPKKYDPNKELQEKGSISKHEDQWKFEEVPTGHKLGEPEILFTKLEYTEELEKADHPELVSVVVKEPIGHDFSKLDLGVVIGKITELKKHSKDDSAKIVKVDTGISGVLTIVCTATNLQVGQVVPVALPGSTVRSLDGKGKNKIKRSKVRGILSDGMLCGTYELGVGDEKKDILILPEHLEEHLGISLSRLNPSH